MSEIRVDPQSVDRLHVTVSDRGSSSEYTVTAPADYVQRVGGGVSAADLVAASFRFLLDREPKESILRRFDLPVIARYFPEYESEIGSYL